MKELRKEKGLNQIELAKNVGVGKSVNANLRSKLIALADFFGVTLDCLAGREE